MRNKNVFNLRKSLPCMSWSPKNLYNLWRRTVGPLSEEITFKTTHDTTLFQQRWKSKAAVRAYHGDFIPEKVFKRWYLPDTLPDVRPRRKTVTDTPSLEEFAKRNVRENELDEEIEKKGMAPVGSLMFSEVERRLDVFLFRCCFVHSVYEARRLIIHGYVTLNGRKHSRANTRLAPGDMVHVDPEAIRFFKKPHGDVEDVLAGIQGNEKAEKEVKEPANSEAEVTANPSVSEGAPPTAEIINGDQLKEETAPSAENNTLTKDTTRQQQQQQNPQKTTKPSSTTPFYLPTYASPWLFIPAYIEVSFQTCTAIYVRHPTARPGYSEIPTPYDADGALIRYAWEWYMQRRPRMRSKSQLARMPEDRVLTVLESLHKDSRYLLLEEEDDELASPSSSSEPAKDQKTMTELDPRQNLDVSKESESEKIVDPQVQALN